MSNKENNFTAILAAVAIGVGLGILFAPDKGSKTREKIKDNFDDLKDQAKDKWESIEEDAKHSFSETKQNFKSALDDVLSKTSYKTEEAILFLEEKLAKLKEENAKFKK